MSEERIPLEAQGTTITKNYGRMRDNPGAIRYASLQRFALFVKVGSAVTSRLPSLIRPTSSNAVHGTTGIAPRNIRCRSISVGFVGHALRICMHGPHPIHRNTGTPRCGR